MIKIKNNTEFSAAGRVWIFDDSSGKTVLKNLREASKSRSKEFVPPMLDEVKVFFKEEGYKEEIAEKAFKHYSRADWHNSKGKKVLNWKQTIGTNWLTPENKITEQENKKNSFHFGDE